MLVIDVSKWQGNINHQKASKKIAGAICKLGGADDGKVPYIDKYAGINYDGFRNNNVPTSVYWFFNPYADLKAQSDYICNPMKPHAKYLPFVIVDVEYPAILSPVSIASATAAGELYFNTNQMGMNVDTMNSPTGLSTRYRRSYYESFCESPVMAQAISPAMLSESSRVARLTIDFIDSVEQRLGVPVYMYSAAWYINKNFGLVDWGKYGKNGWFAYYDNSEKYDIRQLPLGWSSPFMKQYSDKGKIDGIEGDVDMNFCFKPELWNIKKEDNNESPVVIGGGGASKSPSKFAYNKNGVNISDANGDTWLTTSGVTKLPRAITLNNGKYTAQALIGLNDVYSVVWRSMNSDTAVYPNDCGPACATMVAAAYDVDVTVDSVVKEIKRIDPSWTIGSFTSVSQLHQYLLNIGIESASKHIGVGSIPDRPCIALISYSSLSVQNAYDKTFHRAVKGKDGHFVVFERVQGNEVIVHDPLWPDMASGYGRKWSLNEWKAAFYGNVITFDSMSGQDVKPEPVPVQKPYSLFGVHDEFQSPEDAKSILKGDGWMLFTFKFQGDNYPRTFDFQKYGNARKIARLNWDYGGQGTIPERPMHKECAARFAEFVKNSGVQYVTIGNEQNAAIYDNGKWNGERATSPIEPEEYGEFFNLVYKEIKKVSPTCNVITGALQYYAGFKWIWGGYTGITPLEYEKRMWEVISVADGRGIHTYSFDGSPDDVTNNPKFTDDPLREYIRGFGSYRQQIEWSHPKARGIKNYILETNPYGQRGWKEYKYGWIKSIYSDVAKYNDKNGGNIQCVVLFRWRGGAYGEDFSISSNQTAVNEFLELQLT